MFLPFFCQYNLFRHISSILLTTVINQSSMFKTIYTFKYWLFRHKQKQYFLWHDLKSTALHSCQVTAPVTALWPCTLNCKLELINHAHMHADPLSGCLHKGWCWKQRGNIRRVIITTQSKMKRGAEQMWERAAEERDRRDVEMKESGVNRKEGSMSLGLLELFCVLNRLPVVLDHQLREQWRKWVPAISQMVLLCLAVCHHSSESQIALK